MDEKGFGWTKKNLIFAILFGNEVTPYSWLFKNNLYIYYISI